MTRPHSTALLTAANLGKRFHGVEAVRDVSFTVGPGELVGLIGPNGAGKSTTLTMCSGELAPDGGSVHIGPHDHATAPVEARRAFGYVPQHIELPPFLTGRETLDFVADVKGVPAEKRAARIDELLAAFDLTEAAHRLTREYSGGMARKLAVCVALLGEPPLLLLDEPLNGLDPRAAAEIKTHLRSHVESGGGVLITGHVLETMERLCTRVLLIHQGCLVDDIDRARMTELRDAGRTLEDHFLETTGA